MLLATSAAAAGGSIDSGDYTVQYAAVNSLQIPASVAKTNGIERDGSRAVVMITLQKPGAGDPLHAVPAEVTGTARDLLGNRTPLRFRRVRSAGSVYSLADVPIDDDPTLTFELEVDAVDANAVIPVQFNQQFYAE